MERILSGFKTGRTALTCKKVGAVSILFVVALASFNITGCYRPPKDHYTLIQNELKDKTVDFKVGYLVNLIQKGSDAQQSAAVKMLAEIGRPSLSALIDKIKDDRTTNREDYLLTLKLIGEPAAEEVVKLLESKSPLVQEEAAAVLLAIGKDSVPHLVRVLDSKNEKIKSTVVNLLAAIKDERAAEPLSKIFMDLKQDSRLRSKALAALVSIGKKSIPHLAKALHSKDAATREAASLAIEQISRGR